MSSNPLISEDRKEVLTQQIIRSGIREAKKKGLAADDTTAIESLTVQIYAGCARIVVFLIGVGVSSLAVGAFFMEWQILGFVILFFGLLFVYVSIKGRRKTVADSVADYGLEALGQIVGPRGGRRWFGVDYHGALA